ncbi:Caspase domain-containing protein [Ruegeria halocynthiae]|uniref:Caspase domain-containing protein n=1 Tax=Ruegeria halocynthiae TaxID=985054 RepID=A0A1H3FSE2_9RHOB|nr:caspase family protein [Ruegeria halocynthiae]SDX93916.1 Caspase domain-containing protein [Ruegeria halocynthiae]
MAQNDMALVIAIKRYPSFGGNASSASRDLRGPVNDAAAFTEWLKAQDGGDVPSANVFSVTSDDFPAGGPTGPVLKDLTDKLDAFKTALKQPPKKRRLYIYVSGHGYGRRRTEGGLYLADATPNSLTNLFVTDYFNWFMASAHFKECVLFCDACMDQGRLASPSPAHWRREIRPTSHNTKAVGAYAARFAGRAVEGTMSNGQDHGAFSYALKLGLDGAAAIVDAQGNRSITTDSLRDYLIATMQKLMTDAQLQHPLVSTEPDFGPFDTLTLVENAPKFTRLLRVALPPEVANATLELENAALDKLGQVAAVNGQVTLTLAPGMYVLAEIGGWEGAFEFTGAETRIDLG